MSIMVLYTKSFHSIQFVAAQLFPLMPHKSCVAYLVHVVFVAGLLENFNDV